MNLQSIIVAAILTLIGLGGFVATTTDVFDSTKAGKIVEEAAKVVDISHQYILTSATHDMTGITAEKLSTSFKGATLTGTGASSTLTTRVNSVPGVTYSIVASANGRSATISIGNIPSTLEALIAEKLAPIDGAVTNTTADDGIITLTINS